MTYILIIFACLCLYKMKFVTNNQYYLSIEQTQNINAIFVFLIFMSHFVTYIDIHAPYHELYLVVRQYLKQLVVVTFLFFSGYGMYESFKKKGMKYISTIPLRFVKLLFQFDVAVLLFLILSICINKNLSLQQIILSFLGWSSIGNSNWYIFIILCLYIIMYISFRIAKYRDIQSLLLFTCGSILLIFVMRYLGKTSNWYNTILCFSSGMWFSYFKDKYTIFIDKSTYNYIIVLVLLLISFFIAHHFMFKSLISYELMAILFCMIIVTLNKKIEIHNPILNFFGQHIFSIYILQRIPMIIGKKVGMNQNFILYFIFCFVITLIISYIFDLVVGYLENCIFSRKKDVA